MWGTVNEYDWMDQFLFAFGWEAPFQWRHACLSEVKEFLVKEKAEGRYHPLIKEGLD